MEIMDDPYFHQDEKLEYCLENVLYQDSNTDEEYIELKNSYNSILDKYCYCPSNCESVQCAHGQNYIYENEELILNKNRKSKDVIYECFSLCSCEINCYNRIVQKGPRKNLFIKNSNLLKNQVGLFTKNFIPEGAFICEYAGEVITKSEALKRDNIRFKNKSMNYIICMKEQCLEIGDNKVIKTYIDPTLVGNIGRYMNHSCNPNCEIISVRIDCPIPKLAIFSKRNIEPLEELFFHYGGGLKNESVPQNGTKCLCNSQNCQGILPCLDY